MVYILPQESFCFAGCNTELAKDHDEMKVAINQKIFSEATACLCFFPPCLSQCKATCLTERFVVDNRQWFRHPFLRMNDSFRKDGNQPRDCLETVNFPGMTSKWSFGLTSAHWQFGNLRTWSCSVKNIFPKSPSLKIITWMRILSEEEKKKDQNGTEENENKEGKVG